MKLEKEEEDLRGKRWFFVNGEKRITLFEIKKGFARGGQYHNYQVQHILIFGKVEYRKENIVTKEEKTVILSSPSTIYLPPNTSDLIIALDDSLLLGIYKNRGNDKFYHKHRQLVKEKMKVIGR